MISIKNERFGKIFSLLGLIVLSFFIVRSCLRQESDYSLIREKYEFTMGEITDYGVAGASSRLIEYRYYVDSIKFTNSISPRYSLSCESVSYANCIGKKYKVIYSAEYPEKSYLLVERYGYELFKLRVPYQLKSTPN